MVKKNANGEYEGTPGAEGRVDDRNNEEAVRKKGPKSRKRECFAFPRAFPRVK